MACMKILTLDFHRTSANATAIVLYANFQRIDNKITCTKKQITKFTNLIPWHAIKLELEFEFRLDVLI